MENRGTAEIEFNAEGDAYFVTEGGMEVFLNEVMRTENPGTGYYTISNAGGIAVTINDSCDGVYYEFIY